MTKELACRKCRRITTGKVCGNCSSSDLSPDWTGIVLVGNPDISQIARVLGIKKVGKYAIKVA